jgi:protein-S-isoprenylcysteine O-methyltransferase Ste14
MLDKLIRFIKHKNFLLRFLFFSLILIPIIFFIDFYIHIYSHFTGSILPNVITEQWHIVIINILMFTTFLIPLSFRRKINWKEYGLVTAFFVSLFIEMYGIPLSILFVAKSIYPTNIGIARVVYEFEFLGVNIAMDMAMLYATILIIIGTLFILIGWFTLYRNIKKQDLVKVGVYAYSRHPQYLGFILVILGWLIGWPTILTVLFAVILVYKYIKVCRKEEKEMAHIESYKKYKEKVPFFI